MSSSVHNDTGPVQLPEERRFLRSAGNGVGARVAGRRQVILEPRVCWELAGASQASCQGNCIQASQPS